MIPNPAYLGLEALLPKNTVTYQQIQKMSSDLKITSDELVRITGLFINAHTLYMNSLRDPVSYMTAMRTMDLKQPDDLLKMYVSTEEAYEDALQSYEHCVDRYVKYCTDNMQDEKYKLVYLQMIDQALHDYRAVESLDPRGTYEDVTWSVESFQIRDGVDQVSMEGFFKNIANRLSHFLTKDAKCKEIYEGVVASASKASSEADKKFREMEHGFSCPTYKILDQGVSMLPKVMDWILKAVEDAKDHKPKNVVINQKMVDNEKKSRPIAFSLDAVLEKFNDGTEGKSTYGALGYNIKDSIQCMKLFLNVSGRRKELKILNELLEISAYAAQRRNDSTKDPLAFLWFSCNTCMNAYDKFDYVLYRIGKDIKSCL